MGKRVGFYLRCRRLEQKLRYGQLADLLGVERPKAKNKFCRSLVALEQGCYTPELLQRVVNALGLGVEHAAAISNLAEQDEAERQQVMNAPVQRQLFVRWAAGIGTAVDIPDHLTDEQALAFSIQYVNRYPVHACLTLSRRKRLWIKPDGTVEEEHIRSTQPSLGMRVGNKTFKFKQE